MVPLELTLLGELLIDPAAWSSPFEFFIFGFGCGLVLRIAVHLIFVPLSVVRWFGDWGSGK